MLDKNEFIIHMHLKGTLCRLIKTLCLSLLPEINIQKCVKESIQIFCNSPKSATYRQHARTQKKEENRPNVSYYSRDYNEQPTSELVCLKITLPIFLNDQQNMAYFGYMKIKVQYLGYMESM